MAASGRQISATSFNSSRFSQYPTSFAATSCLRPSRANTVWLGNPACCLAANLSSPPTGNLPNCRITPTSFSNRVSWSYDFVKSLGSKPASITASPQRAQYFPYQSHFAIPVAFSKRDQPSGFPPFSSAVRRISARTISLFITANLDNALSYSTEPTARSRRGRSPPSPLGWRTPGASRRHCRGLGCAASAFTHCPIRPAAP